MNAIEPTKTDQPGIPPWLAALMLRRGSGALSRVAAYYRELAALPRPWRRRLQRRLAVGLTSATLLLALATPAAYLSAGQAGPAAPIAVANGVVEIAPDGQCSLIEAIVNAQATLPRQLHADCLPGNLSGPDTIVLPENGSFTLTHAYDDQYNGLPPITGEVTIEGNGATIAGLEQEWPAEESFRIFKVTRTGDLTLTNATIAGGILYNVEAGPPTAAGIDNRGTLTLIDSEVAGNKSYNCDQCASGIFNSGQAGILGGEVSNYGYPVGGIWNTGEMTIRAARLDNESGDGVGGILNTGDLLISGSTLDDFSCQWAGMSNSGDLLLLNSTISGFDPSTSTTGYCGAHGIDNTGTMTLTNSTVTDNFVYYSPFIHNHGRLVLNRSILHDNVQRYACDYYWWDSCEGNLLNDGTVIANNFNVIGREGDPGVEGFTPGPLDMVPDGPVFRAKGFFGGNGLAFAPASDGPAIDLAPSADCAADPVNGVDQRGQPRNSDGDGANSGRECDAGAIEMQPAELENAVLVTTTAGGTTSDGLAFRKTDILKWNGVNWTRFFDGRANGLPAMADIAAISVPAAVEPDIYLSFASPVRVPGAGYVTPHDIVRWDGTRFSLYFDGSDVGLTARGERIDSLDVLPYYDRCRAVLFISPTGAGELPGRYGSWWDVLSFTGSDVLAFCLRNPGYDTLPETGGQFDYNLGWIKVLEDQDHGLRPNAIFSIAATENQSTRYINPYSYNSLYLTTKGQFAVDDALGGHSMVYRYDKRGEPYYDNWFSGPYFSAADHGLLQKVDGLEVLGNLP